MSVVKIENTRSVDLVVVRYDSTPIIQDLTWHQTRMRNTILQNLLNYNAVDQPSFISSGSTEPGLPLPDHGILMLALTGASVVNLDYLKAERISINMPFGTWFLFTNSKGKFSVEANENSTHLVKQVPIAILKSNSVL